MGGQWVDSKRVVRNNSIMYTIIDTIIAATQVYYTHYRRQTQSHTAHWTLVPRRRAWHSVPRSIDHF